MCRHLDHHGHSNNFLECRTLSSVQGKNSSNFNFKLQLYGRFSKSRVFGMTRFLSTRSSITRLGIPMASTATSTLTPGPYAGWTRERLVERLMQLEGTAPKVQDVITVGSLSQPSNTPIQDINTRKTFDFSKHSRRKIALKFCYSGWEYSGLAHQMGPTPLPTIENVLFDALAKAHLVDPVAEFEGCGWERCGRTDRGVSAAGQVVSLWVRSQVLPKAEDVQLIEENIQAETLTLETECPNISVLTSQQSSKPVQELDYLGVLNRILPDTIRVIAWSPVSEDFSARFSCKYRHYKYIFSSLHLDIPRMEAAAARLLGEHDFRNLCKLDVQKQLTSFKRKILRANFTLLEGTGDGRDRMYVFDLVGTAFLYHQVRHIMAVLFLVGSGLEAPEVVTELMNVEDGAEPLLEDNAAKGKVYTIVGSKPDYQMADGLPLMLWECGYDDSELDWRTSSRVESGSGDIVRGDLYHQIHGIYTRSRVYSALDQLFVKAVEKHHPPPPKYFPLRDIADNPKGGVINVPLGGGTFKRLQKYKPLLERKRLDTVEVMNERWRLGKGFRKDEKRRAVGQSGVDD